MTDFSLLCQLVILYGRERADKNPLDKNPLDKNPLDKNPLAGQHSRMELFTPYHLRIESWRR